MESAALKHFGITHYSPSTLNLFTKSLGNFIMEKVLDISLPVGAAAHRGAAVEDGLVAIFKSGSLDEGQKEGLASFDRRIVLTTDPKRDDERKAVPKCIEQAWAHIKDWGPPDIFQHKISYQHPDLPLPIEGYIDFAWSEHRRIVDLKAQLRLSSKINETHARQIAVYNAAFGWDWSSGILYASPTKSALYKLENGKEHLDAVVKIAQAMERFLSISPDPGVLASIVAPDFESFYWNDPKARQRGFRIWGY